MKVYFLIGLLVLVNCDLPVHCVKHQIQGRWKLSLEKPKLSGFGQLSCGHSIPDSSKTSNTAYIHDFKEEWNTDVELGEDYKVRRVGDNTIQGQWTMVYDEGFEITHKNIKYFAFSKYEGQGRSATSFCDQTLVGWYHNFENGDRGCYKAQKSEKIEANAGVDQVSVVQPEFMDENSMNSLGFLQTKSSEKKLHYSHHEEVVNKLNSIEGTWTAKVYDHLVGKTFAELNSKSGRKQHFQGKREKQPIQQTEFIQVGDSGLPDSFSWKDKLAPVRQQEQCGSCYAIATMEMLSARLKIKGENVDLSPQWSINCNVYNQGCDGGYPYLVNKFAQEVQLVPESAEPYTGYDGSCNMQKVDSLKKAYSVRNYQYLGGGYGRQSEQLIMKEILENGPVVLSFEPAYDFMYYQSGIYHSKAESSDYPEWEKVDHSVLCYGWGEEKGQKYWLLQNSWGPQWGEDGFFRMKRGVDESAIESMAEAAEPYVIEKQQADSKKSSFVQDDGVKVAKSYEVPDSVYQIPQSYEEPIDFDAMIEKANESIFSFNQVYARMQ